MAAEVAYRGPSLLFSIRDSIQDPSIFRTPMLADVLLGTGWLLLLLLCSTGLHFLDSHRHELKWIYSLVKLRVFTLPLGACCVRDSACSNPRNQMHFCSDMQIVTLFSEQERMDLLLKKKIGFIRSKRPSPWNSRSMACHYQANREHIWAVLKPKVTSPGTWGILVPWPGNVYAFNWGL